MEAINEDLLGHQVSQVNCITHQAFHSFFRHLYQGNSKTQLKGNRTSYKQVATSNALSQELQIRSAESINQCSLTAN